MFDSLIEFEQQSYEIDAELIRHFWEAVAFAFDLEEIGGHDLA